MSDTTVYAEVGFDSKVSDTLVQWTDVTDYVNAIAGKRGRTYELDRIEAGTAKLEFDNADGRFTPGSDWLPVLSEYFGAVQGSASTTGADTSVMAGSGRFYVQNVAGTGASITPMTEGGVKVDAPRGLYRRFNLFHNPSAEGANGWGFFAQLAGSGFDTAQSFRGTRSWKAITNGTTGGGYVSSNPGTVAGGRTYTASMYVYSTVAVQITPVIEWKDAGGTKLLPSASGAPVAIPAATWTRVDVTGTAPAGASLVTLTGYTTGTLPPSGTPVWYDAAHLEEGSSLLTYFDGTTTGSFSYGWVDPASPHNSLSAQSDTGATLKGMLDVKVPAGQLFKVTAKVRAYITGGTGKAQVRIRKYWADAAGNLSPLEDAAMIPSNGSWTTVTGSFTAPDLVSTPTYDHMRVAVVIIPATVGENVYPLTAELASIRVQAAAPYAGKVKPRKPVRVYGVADDNRLHVDAVNANRLNTDGLWRWSLNPSFHDVTEVDWWSDWATIGGRDVFWMDSWDQGNTMFLPHAEGDADAIPVKKGDVVTFSAKVGNTADSGTDGRVRLCVVAALYGEELWNNRANGAWFTANPGVLNASEISWTAPWDGAVKAQVQCESLTALRASCYVADLKVRVNGGTSAIAEVSGTFPVFRGYVERWTQEYDSTLSTVTVECVDSTAVLTAPIDTLYRSGIRGWLEGVEATPGQVSYWPGVEGEDATQASPVIGTAPLKVKQAEFAPESYGFTTEKVMTWSDGENSGGFTVGESSTDNKKGAALEWSRDYRPDIGRPSRTEVDLWYKPTDLAVKAYLWEAFVNTSQVHSQLWVNTDGSIEAVSYRNDDTGTITCKSAAGVIVAGKSHHINLEVTVATSTYTPTLTITVDDSPVAFNFMSNNGPYPAPRISRANFGAHLTTYANGNRVYWNTIRGTIAHMMVLFDLPGGLHTTIHQYAQDTFTERETYRFTRVLDNVGWKGPRIVDPWQSILAIPRWNQGTDGRSVLDATAESAGGMFFVGPAGEAIYQNRQRRIGAPAVYTVREWNPGLRFEIDDSQLFNSIRVERASGLYRVAEDAESIAEYGAKALTLVRDVADPLEIEDAAWWTLHRYGTPVPRCDTLQIAAHTLNGSTDGPLRALAYGARLSDRVSLVDLPDTAPADQLGFFVEGIQVNIVRDGSVWRWVTTLAVSDARRSDAWVLEGDSGTLDSESCVAIY
ncbi:hypothetical protein [Micromonospora coerulea]|uniref:hypothetical protein n=1 Tax=Micromonospora coerulea TaxID=47856 RepID=UPI0019056B62|nr:hypothetical protein [Micromonospora veneta]